MAGPEPDGSLSTMLFPNGTLGEIWKDGHSWSSNRSKLVLFSELSKSYLTPRVEPVVESGILHGENNRTSNALRVCSPKEAVACDGDRKKNRDRSPQHLHRDLHRQPHVACNCGLLSMLRMLICCMIVFEHAPAAFCEGSIVEDSFADSWEDVRNQLSGGVYSNIGGGWCFDSQFSPRTNGTGTSAVYWDAGVFSAFRLRTGRVTAQPRLEPVFPDLRAQETPAQETPAPLDIKEESWGPRWRPNAFNVFGARSQIGVPSEALDAVLEDPAEGSQGDPEPENERTPKRRLIGVPGNVDLGSLRTGDQLIIKALKEESSRRWAEAARLGLATPGHNRLTEPEPLLSHVTGLPPPDRLRS